MLDRAICGSIRFGSSHVGSIPFWLERISAESLGGKLLDALGADMKIGRRPVTWDWPIEGIRSQPAVDLGVHTLVAQCMLA